MRIAYSLHTLALSLSLLGLSLSSLAQANDPAITARNLSPAPIPGGVGAPFSVTFTIGNLGTAPISGVRGLNQMGFTMCLGASQPASGTATNALASLSGPLLAYFDVQYLAPTSPVEGGCYLARQKEGVSIGARSVYDIYLDAVVLRASTDPTINDIGASANIQPNPTANPQPSSNDFTSVYTHTTNALPVSLVGFTAQAQADRSVLLNWKTSWEKSNQGYVIERSKDLKRFEEVGQVKDVAGSSPNVNAYQYVDQRPYRGTSYYRLVQVDVDGSRHTYKAESVVIDGRYGVYPNPVVSHSFTLELDEPESAVLHLYDGSGRQVRVSQSELTELSTKVSPASKLSAGVYVLTVEERGQLRRHRLVVQ